MPDLELSSPNLGFFKFIFIVNYSGTRCVINLIMFKIIFIYWYVFSFFNIAIYCWLRIKFIKKISPVYLFDAWRMPSLFDQFTGTCSVTTTSSMANQILQILPHNFEGTLPLRFIWQWNSYSDCLNRNSINFTNLQLNFFPAKNYQW